MSHFLCRTCDTSIPHGREMETLSIGFERFGEYGELEMLDTASTFYCVSCLPNRMVLDLRAWKCEAAALLAADEVSVGATVSCKCFECGDAFVRGVAIFSVCLIREFYDAEAKELAPLSADWIYACCLACIPESKKVCLPSSQD